MTNSTDKKGRYRALTRSEAGKALMPADTRINIARAFLEELFGASSTGLIEIRIRTASTQWRRSWFRRAAAAAERAVSCDEEGADVFFGIGPRSDRGSTARSVHALGCAWVDIDPSGDGDLDEERMGILHRLLTFVPAASIIISSGHGAHAYWLLEQMAPPDRVRAINLGLARRLGADTNACDPARLLRVPGTHNRKSEPVLVLPWSGWAPGQRARRYHIDELRALEAARPIIASHTSHVNDDAQAEVIEKVLAHGRGAKRQSSGKVSLCCPFHEDQHASAVVFPNGHFLCSACGVNESVARWAQRPEVTPWELAGAARRRKAGPLLPPGYLKAPRSAITTVGPILLQRRIVALPQGRAPEVRVLDPSRIDLPFDEPERLNGIVRQICGALAFRVFWVSIALAQFEHSRSQTQGEFRFDPRRVGDLLGFARVGDGRHHGNTRTRIRQAIEGLTQLDVRFQWSPVTPWIGAPIVARLGDLAAGAEVYRLHPGIWRQMSGSSPAWMAWDPMALRLGEEALALHFHARWAHHVKTARRGDEPLRFDLARMATDAGVWRPERYAKNRGRYLDEWQRKLSAAAELGLALELGKDGAVLVVSSLSAESLALQPVAHPEATLLPSLPDLLAGNEESPSIPMVCEDDFRAECTNFRDECTKPGGALVSDHTKTGTHEAEGEVRSGRLVGAPVKGGSAAAPCNTQRSGQDPSAAAAVQFPKRESDPLLTCRWGGSPSRVVAEERELAAESDWQWLEAQEKSS